MYSTKKPSLGYPKAVISGCMIVINLLAPINFSSRKYYTCHSSLSGATDVNKTYLKENKKNKKDPSISTTDSLVHEWQLPNQLWL